MIERFRRDSGYGKISGPRQHFIIESEYLNVWQLRNLPKSRIELFEIALYATFVFIKNNPGNFCVSFGHEVGRLRP